MNVHYSTPAEEDMAYWRQHSKKITQRIESIIEVSFIRFMKIACTSFNAGIIIDGFQAVLGKTRRTEF